MATSALPRPSAGNAPPPRQHQAPSTTAASCFKCGVSGHWSRDCTASKAEQDAHRRERESAEAAASAAAEAAAKAAPSRRRGAGVQEEEEADARGPEGREPELLRGGGERKEERIDGERQLRLNSIELETTTKTKKKNSTPSTLSTDRNGKKTTSEHTGPQRPTRGLRLLPRPRSLARHRPLRPRGQEAPRPARRARLRPLADDLTKLIDLYGDWSRRLLPGCLRSRPASTCWRRRERPAR